MFLHGNVCHSKLEVFTFKCSKRAPSFKWESAHFSYQHWLVLNKSLHSLKMSLDKHWSKVTSFMFPCAREYFVKKDSPKTKSPGCKMLGKEIVMIFSWDICFNVFNFFAHPSAIAKVPDSAGKNTRVIQEWKTSIAHSRCEMQGNTTTACK